jgi:Na+-driven multidrug efflux pump
MMVVFGIGHGVMPMVGFNLGARLYDRLLETVRVALIFSTILAGLSGLVLFFAADPILSLFTTDPALKDVALPALRI